MALEDVEIKEVAILKKILISTAKDREDSLDYKNAIRKVNGIADAFYLPNYSTSFLTKLSDEYDALILSGGGDVNPKYYDKDLDGSERIDSDRDTCEFSMIKRFMEQNKPVLGICRGIQVMNVYLGGTLYQDDGEELNSVHRGYEGTYRVHSTYCKDSFLNDLYGETFNVNSYHHQSLDIVPPELEIIQYSSDNKTIEAVRHKYYPFIGVQWHPERLCKEQVEEKDCIDSTKFFEYFMGMIKD